MNTDLTDQKKKNQISFDPCRSVAKSWDEMSETERELETARLCLDSARRIGDPAAVREFTAAVAYWLPRVSADTGYHPRNENEPRINADFTDKKSQISFDPCKSAANSRLRRAIEQLRVESINSHPGQRMLPI